MRRELIMLSYKQKTLAQYSSIEHRVSRSGFTLAEVVVASLLMVVAMVPILKALTGAHRIDVKIERRTRSLQLAQARLENIRAESIYSYETNFNDPSSSMDGSYLCKVRDRSVAADLRAISLSVGYDQNGNGILEVDEVEVDLNTLLARRWP